MSKLDLLLPRLYNAAEDVLKAMPEFKAYRGDPNNAPNLHVSNHCFLQGDFLIPQSANLLDNTEFCFDCSEDEQVAQDALHPLRVAVNAFLFPLHFPWKHTPVSRVLSFYNVLCAVYTGDLEVPESVLPALPFELMQTIEEALTEEFPRREDYAAASPKDEYVVFFFHDWFGELEENPAYGFDTAMYELLRFATSVADGLWSLHLPGFIVSSGGKSTCLRLDNYMVAVSSNRIPPLNQQGSAMVRAFVKDGMDLLDAVRTASAI